MNQKNQKIGERHSDLECSRCGRELKWIGGIMDGKMTCPNNFCMESPSPKVVTTAPDKYLEFSGSGIPVIPAPSPGYQPPQPVNAVMARYYMEVTYAHRAWCHTHISPGFTCDCGYLIPCVYPQKVIERMEVNNYGQIVP